MILAVDVGNTHIVLGCIEGEKAYSVSRIATDSQKTEYEYSITIRDILSFSGVALSNIDGAIISSVVPSLTPILQRSIKLLTGKEALIVGVGIKTGLNIRIDDPSQLGADLVVGAVAALSLLKPPIIIIDMGTATTISVLDKKGYYIGGAIVPGVALSYEALSGGASLLPRISLNAPQKCISSNTVSCMQSGAVYGTASLLDGMIDRIDEELCEQANVIATGGISGSIIPFCHHSIQYEPDLLLMGLSAIWKKNRTK